MDYAINDPRLAKSVPQILAPNYSLDMQCSHYRGWVIALNLALTEEVVKVALFFRDHGAEVFVTVPDMDAVRQDLAAYLVTMKVPVFAIAGSNFREVHHLYRKVAAASVHLYVDTNCVLSGYASAMHADSANTAYAVLETELSSFPGFFLQEDNSFNGVARLLATPVIKGSSFTEPMSYRLFRMIDSFIANSRKFKPKAYSFNWLENLWRAEK